MLKLSTSSMKKFIPPSIDLSLPSIRLQKVYFPKKIYHIKVLNSNKTQN